MEKQIPKQERLIEPAEPEPPPAHSFLLLFFDILSEFGVQNCPKFQRTVGKLSFQKKVEKLTKKGPPSFRSGGHFGTPNRAK